MDNLHIVNLASYNRPQISEDKQREWVNYGDDNNYYQYLIDLYTNSTTNHAIINGVVNMIYGKGIDALNNSQKPNEYAALRSILSKDCLRKVCLDLKLLGEGSFQVLYQDSKVVKSEHFPRQTLRPEKCDENGDIKAYYYSPDWVKVKPNDKPQRIAAFGFGNGKEPEIKICRKYVSGYDYISPVDYQGGLAYAELESEVADYLMNDVRNGFSGTKIVNFNNGIPDANQQLQIKNDVMRKLTGSRGEKVVIAFNNNAESKTTVDDIPLNDAPAHYEYLSNECSNKLIVAHRVTSPLLLGIRTENNGLGSNADEIKTAALLFDNITIKPYQDLLTDCIDDILAVNDISLKLYFKTLQPLSFIETDNLVTDEAREEETGVKMASDKTFDDNKMFELLSELGEDEDLENWELVDEREVDYDQEEAFDKMIGLARVGTAKPNSKSKQDKKVDGVEFKVRYKYSPETTQANSREFCKKMTQFNKLYRKEDIISMSTQAVNKGWGEGGADTYSIWLYKGGGACHHKWLRKTFRGKTEGNIANKEANISTNKARKEGFNPVNEKEVSMKPKDMPNQGFVNK
tara:strand:+ start:1683 stop:3404 length:1722 start_codon:yes stop_codon:yes gene_type:complete